MSTESIDEINEVVEWYTTLPFGYNDVNDLMFGRQKLTGYLFRYTTELGEVRKAWNKAQAIRENEKSKLEAREVHQGIGKAEIFAKANTTKEFDLEKKLEGAYYSHKENVESIREVLNAMNQHIAIARDESTRRNFQG